MMSRPDQDNSSAVEPYQARQQAQQSLRHGLIRSFADVVAIAELVTKANALPDVRNAGQAVLKILCGIEMGFGPFASLVDIHIIDGKPSVGAHLKAAAIKQSTKYDFEVVEQDEAGAVCELAFFERVATTGGSTRKLTPGWKEIGRIRLTIEACIGKGLTQGKFGTKSNWRSSPDDMLFARCVSKGYKRYCSDLTGGVLTYDPDELDNTTEPTSAPALLPAPEPARTSMRTDAADVIPFERSEEKPEERPQEVSSLLPINPVASAQQVNRIIELSSEMSVTQEQVVAGARKRFNREVAAVSHLTSSEAGQVIEGMERKLAERKAIKV